MTRAQEIRFALFMGAIGVAVMNGVILLAAFLTNNFPRTP